LEREKQKWAKEKDKALKCIVAWIDNKVLEGSFGGKEFLHFTYHSSTYS